MSDVTTDGQEPHQGSFGSAADTHGAGTERFVDLMDLSALLGSYAWVEHRLFETLGSWSAEEPQAHIALALADHSRRHIWHSELLFERIPELTNVDADGLVAPRSEEERRLLDSVAEQAATIERLVAAYRVMCPQLIGRYEQILGGIGEVAAPSVHRWLRFIIGDLVEQWRWGEATIRQQVRSEAHLQDALDAQRRLEMLLL